MSIVPFRRTGSLAITAALLVAVAGCSSAATPSASPAASTPAASPSAVASAVASGLPSPSPLPMSVKSIDKNVKAGTKAGLTVATEDGAECTIVVTYATGPATDSGLAPSVAASNGYVQWGWTVPADTAPGTVPVKVSCTKGARSGQLETEFTVK